MMKNNGNFLLGLILIVFGGLWLARTMGFIEISLLHLFFRFWPVLLILAGINIIFKGNKSILFLLRILEVLIVILVIVSGVLVGQQDDKTVEFFGWEYDFNFDEESIKTYRGNFELKDAESATLLLNLGAGDIDVKGTSDDKFEFKVPDYKISKSVVNDNGHTTIEFKHEKGFHINAFKSNHPMKYDFELPENILWSVNVDAGATDTKLDLSDLIVENVDIDAGASDCKLILGNLNDMTSVNIDTGVSDFDLSIKEGMGVRIHTDQAISDNNFNEIGLTKIGDYYETKNYDTASSKIEIEIDSAISDVRLKFY